MCYMLKVKEDKFSLYMLILMAKGATDSCLWWDYSSNNLFEKHYLHIVRIVPEMFRREFHDIVYDV